MATSTVKPAYLGLDREVVLYGLVKVRSTARSATIRGWAKGGQIGFAPPGPTGLFMEEIAKIPTFMHEKWGFRRISRNLD
jgi:hypothetical protein